MQEVDGTISADADLEFLLQNGIFKTTPQLELGADLSKNSD